MGGCLSCRSSSSSSSFDNVRVVHINGYVQHFHHPVSVRHVTAGKPPEHFLCTPAQLVSAPSSPALNPDALLHPGNIYFMLPLSTLHPDVSPMDLASIARKLTAAAKSAGKPASPPHGPQRSPRREVEGPPSLMMYGSQRSPWSRSWRPLLDTIKEKTIEPDSERVGFAR